jgi:methanogenic corrinoid protein MtbC1
MNFSRNFVSAISSKPLPPSSAAAAEPTRGDIRKMAEFICLSALLTTTMLNQKRFIEMLRQKNLYGKYKVLVGGAPATRKWADDIGAQGFAENAALAVKAAKAAMAK